MTDFHTHSFFSGDAESSLEENVRAALAANCKYFAPTEHFNPDFARHKINIPPSDLDGYAREFARLRRICGNKINLTYGVEIGYDGDSLAENKKAVETYDFEYVVNSVHLIKGVDCYTGYFNGRPKKQAFINYMRAVRESLDAPYRYNTLGHFGYITRNCPYEDKDMYAAEPDLCDDILKTVIKKGVILEVNSAVRSAPQPALPARKILMRYRELGGELIIYGSDAHQSSSVMRSRPAVMRFLSDCGFKYHTALKGREILQLPIE